MWPLLILVLGIFPGAILTNDPLPPSNIEQGPTLEDVLSGAWEDLVAHRTAACPICHGAMAPRYGSGPSAVGGRCGGCGWPVRGFRTSPSRAMYTICSPSNSC